MAVWRALGRALLGPRFLVGTMIRSRLTDHKCKRRRGEKPRWGKDFWREVIGHQVVPAAVTIETGDRIWRSQDATAFSSQAFWPESLSTLWQTVRSSRLWIFFQRGGGASNFFKAFIATQQRKGLRLLPCLAETAGGG